MQGIGDVGGRADGGEYLVEDAARLDVILLTCSLFVIGLDKGLTAVALAEGYLAFKGTDGNGQRLVGLEEGVL